MTAPKWPDSVPVLTAEDIHQGELYGPNDTRCLLGWCWEVSGSGAIYSAMVSEIHQELGLRSVHRFNDTHPKAEVAEVWNATMRRLGYTEIEEVDA